MEGSNALNSGLHPEKRGIKDLKKVKKGHL
jgi:hypothetical protein